MLYMVCWHLLHRDAQLGLQVVREVYQNRKDGDTMRTVARVWRNTHLQDAYSVESLGGMPQQNPKTPKPLGNEWIIYSDYKVLI